MPGGFSPPPGPAERGAETERSDGSRSAALLRGVLVPALVTTVVGLAFVVVFLDAFHAPTPHGLPVAVAGSREEADQVTAALRAAAPRDFVVVTERSEASARDALLRRKVYGAFVADGPVPRLLVAGANGQAVTKTLTQAFGPITQKSGKQLQLEDVRPLAAQDLQGLGIFYGAFGVVLGGFLFGIQSYQAAPKLILRWRLVSILLFGAVSGLLVAWAAVVLYAAIPAGFWTVFALVGLLALAVAAPAALALRTIGSAGTFVTSIALVILGNATSTGNLPAEFLPPWLHPLAEILPPGVAVRALRGAAYFQDDGLSRAVWVLALWSVVPLLLIALLDRVRRGRRSTA